MSSPRFLNTRGWTGSAVLLLAIAITGGSLAAWKHASIRNADAAAARQPEPIESVTLAVAQERQYQPTTTSIGTVLALNSITLRNELAGTVRRVMLTPGQVVEAGTVLVALDVSVEEAELEAQTAQADLTETTLARLERLRQAQATSQEEVDQARAARDVALAQIARTRAIIARKTIRAPFRARVGIADVHPGQYLNEGTELTTLQGVDAAANVDFTVAQAVAAELREGDPVSVLAAGEAAPITARIVAIDARIDPTTRNALVRARITSHAPAPGSSVRVEVPVGPPATAVAIPVSALRKGPGGDHVFAIAPDSAGNSRAHSQPVQSGTVVGDEVLILSGLAAGERVATSGSFKLRDAALVAVAGDSLR
ncbi:MAG TPA: efflux RND transporter periplasmic adaptor subunit [Gemmatimonadales bacterium]